jgi:hypothetical protein
VRRPKQDVGHTSYRTTDNFREAIEDTVPQLIQMLDDSDWLVRRDIVNVIVKLAKNGA